MELVKYIGKVTKGVNKYTRTYGIYKCKCGTEFTADISAVRRGRITQCRKCGNKRAPQCKIDTMRRLYSIHNNKYEYTKFIHPGTTKCVVTVTCPIHGDFSIGLRQHLVGNGCQSCAQDKRSLLNRTTRQDPAIVYYMHFYELNLWKLGVTIQDVKRRWAGEVRKFNILLEIPFDTAQMAYEFEDNILRTFHNIRYTGDRLLHRKGNTELLTKDIYDYLVASVETRT